MTKLHKYTTRYDGEWTPATGVSAEQAEKTLGMFPKVRDGASLNALAKIIHCVSSVEEFDGWYEFSLCGGHRLVCGSVNYD